MKTLKIYKSKLLGNNKKILIKNINGEIKYSTISTTSKRYWDDKDKAHKTFNYIEWVKEQELHYDKVEVIDDYTTEERNCFIGM